MKNRKPQVQRYGLKIANVKKRMDIGSVTLHVKLERWSRCLNKKTVDNNISEVEGGDVEESK